MRTKMQSVKKLISLVLCVVMCISLIPAQNYIDSVVAADETAENVPTTFYIGSTQITSSGYWKNDGAGALTTEGASETDYNVYYDGANGVVIKDLNISTCYSETYYHYGVYAGDGQLNIEVIGENTIDMTSAYTTTKRYCRGISAGWLALSGGGKLTVKSGAASRMSTAIRSSNTLTIDDVEVHCVGGKGTNDSSGISASDAIFSNSIIRVETATTSSTRYGISVSGIEVENSNINCDNCGTYGIYAGNDDVIIKNSTVSSINNVTAVQGANLSITGSNVTLQGSTKSMNLTGQLDYASGHLTASGSRTATVNVTAQEYWWRTANDDLFVKNSYQSSSLAYLELTTTHPENAAKATIIFDAGERTFTDDTSVKIVTLEDGYITESQIPTLDTCAGYFFNYWKTEDGTEVDFTQEFSDTIIITPKFTQPSVLVANTDISEGGYWLNDGNGGITKDGASENNYNLYYDGAGNITLNGLVVTEGTNYLRAQYTSGYYGLYSTTGLTVTLTGENKIDISEEVVYVATYGIYSAGVLCISGDGSLYIHARTSSGYTSASSYGIYAGGAVNATSANLEVIGESASSSSSYYGYGIYGATTLTLIASDVMAKGSYGIYTKSGTTLNENAELHAISTGNRNYESIYGNIAINAGTVIAERTSTGKCFNSTPTFSTNYWWRNQNQGNYLLNTYVSENSHYEELTTEEPDEVALTYVTLNANGGTIDGASSKTIFTNQDGNITKEIFDTDPIYWEYYLDGWFTETEYTNEVDLYNTTFSEPTTLYAKWNAIEITIGEVNVSAGGYWMNDGSGGLTQEGASESNYNVYYDGEANLTLRDLNITGQYENVSYKATLNFRVPLTVTLIGENVIRTATGSGICATKDTVFQGIGTLNCVEVESSKGNGSRCFYATGTLTIDGAKLYVDCMRTTGLYASSLTVKNGGVLEACGGEANTSSYHTAYGIYIGDTLNLSDGTVKGVGGEACYTSDNTYSYGVYANKIVVSGGKLEGIAGKVSRDEAWSSSPYYCSNGIYATTSIEVSGGEVVGVGNDVNSLNSYAWTYGISVGNSGTMNITGGKVIGQCGTAIPSNTTLKRQYGLYNVALNMTGGELILGSGMSKAPKNLPEEYRWRTTKTGELTSSADTAYTYSANNYLQIISENLVSEKTVTLYSITTDGTLSVSTVSGAGIYNVGNTVQIQTKGVEDYIFKGWYVAQVNENNECVGYDADAKVSNDIAYSFEIAENVRYVAVYEKITSKVTGYTLSLNGDIAVNIHMTLTKDVLADATAYIKVTFADGETIEKKVSELDTRTVNGTTNYIFVCNVQAPEMSDVFVVELITESATSQLDTYSVKEYGDYVLSNTGASEEYADAAPIVKAMLNYGGYSQLQFSHNTDALANADIYTEGGDPVLAGVIPSLDSFAFTAPSTNIGVKYYGTSLLLNSETTIRHYFTFTTGDDIETIRKNYEFKLADETILTPVMRGGMIYIDIKNINAADLDTMYQVTVTNIETNENITFSYSALSYAKYVLDYALAGTNLVNVVRAMYFYNDAANAYFR